MHSRTKTALIAATATLGLAVSASAASAVTMSGGAFEVKSANEQVFTIAGVNSVICDNVNANGTASGTSSVAFTPAFSNCIWGPTGQPASVSVSGPWTVTLTGGTAPNYTGKVDLNSSVATVSVPSAGCTITVSGPQTFTNGVGGNIGTGGNVGTHNVGLTVLGKGIVWSATPGCGAGASGTDGEYDTSGQIVVGPKAPNTSPIRVNP